MTEAESDDDSVSLDGLPVERAATGVTGAEEQSDKVRETLAIVAQDGIVRRTAVDDAVANASMVVATAETRVELAADRLESARATAAPVSGLDLVAARIDNFDARLTTIDDRADNLGEAVQEVLAMKADGDLYEIARRIRRVTNAATEVQRAADDLQFELESFEEWLGDADRRIEELTADIDALAESVDELDDIADTLAGDHSGPEHEPARTRSRCRETPAGDRVATAVPEARVSGVSPGPSDVDVFGPDRGSRSDIGHVATAISRPLQARERVRQRDCRGHRLGNGLVIQPLFDRLDTLDGLVILISRPLRRRSVPVENSGYRVVYGARGVVGHGAYVCGHLVCGRLGEFLPGGRDPDGLIGDGFQAIGESVVGEQLGARDAQRVQLGV